MPKNVARIYKGTFNCGVCKRHCAEGGDFFKEPYTEESKNVQGSRRQGPRRQGPQGPSILSYGKRSQGGQRKRFKDSLKNNLKRFDIDTGLWESAAADRSRWRTAIREGSLLFESIVLKSREILKKGNKIGRPHQSHIITLVNLA